MTIDHLLEMFELEGNSSAEKGCEIILENPHLIDELIPFVTSDEWRYRYPAAKSLALVSAKQPQILEPWLEYFHDLIFYRDKIIVWYAIEITANLLPFDENDIIGPEYFDKLKSMMNSKSIADATTGVLFITKLALAKREYLDDTVYTLMNIQNYYKKDNVSILIRHSFDCFEKLFADEIPPSELLEYISQFKNFGHKSTEKKAIKLLKKFGVG
jgi:hypothetical protein